MEPLHIKHYLKQAGFLALATYAGECTHTISNIHQKQIFITAMRLTRVSTPQTMIATKQVWNVA
jgi:hypothetical protein